ILSPVSPRPEAQKGIAKKASAAGKWALENADVVIACGLGLVFAILGLANVFKGDALPEATLAVLSLLALALTRERLLREKAGGRLDDLDAAIGDLNQTVHALHAGNQYHVVSHQATWDITAADGTVAYAHRAKRLKLDQNNVLAVLDYTGSTTGAEEDVEYTVDARPAEVLTEHDEYGTRYRLVSLGRLYRRDEELVLVVKRTLRDVFDDPVNSVSAQTDDVTALLQLTIMWPQGLGPTALRLTRTTMTGMSTQSLPLELVRPEKGRPVLHFDVPEPEPGSRTTIAWDWQKGA
ncbi:MAG: hypothetical protein QOE17_2656, partial [Gaiellales bacterium]|nr:hypothetical protein [Gaiellales bacterium]